MSSLDPAGFEALKALVPGPPSWMIDWEAIWTLFPEFAALDSCPQDPIHHAEGDVGTHTRMVVEALVEESEWRELSADDRSLLFWAACLHDIGKPATTKHEDDGRITSRGHSRLGSMMARGILREAGSDFRWREQVCGIIAHHQLPFWLIERPDPTRLAIETSLTCTPGMLCLHAHADALGRICADRDAIVENVALARETFAEAGCLDAPFPFANAESRLGFVERVDRDPHYAAHEEFRCTAYVMSALPGSGKDTWLAQNMPDVPSVSLDDIRQVLGAPATGNQGRVIQAAYEQAKAHLRQGQDFVWNGTNISRLVRGKVLRLLRDYNARIHIVYLEVPPQRLLKQNKARESAVPQAVIETMARKLEPPTLAECHELTLVLNGCS